MRRPVLALMFVLLGTHGCKGSGSEIVARVGDHELTVEQLSNTLAEWDSRPLELDFVDQFVMHWVHLGLLSERFAEGDSLLDSSLVLEVMWPDVSEFLISDLLDRLHADRLSFDSANVDSIYRAGELRVVWHTLYRANTEASVQERETQHTLASGLRAHLARQDAWKELTQRNETGALTLVRGGSLELFKEGQTVPEFDRATRALGPGELSSVVETSVGFHVIYRPHLKEIEPEFARWSKRDLVAEFDTTYGQRLVEDGQLELKPGALTTVREVAESPGLHLDGDAVVASYRGGALTTGRIVRWLQYLPPDMNVQLLEATDDGVVRILRDIVRREMLWDQVDSAGLRLADSVFVWLRGRYQTDLTRVSRTLGISRSSLTEAAGTPNERHEIARERVARYLDAVVTGRGGMATLQPFLAEWLRRNGDWMVRRSAMDQAIEFARTIRNSPE